MCARIVRLCRNRGVEVFLEFFVSAASRMITTFSGRVMNPLEPSPDDFCLIDIAHSLSMKCRYGGHCRFFYSVAQHLVLCAEVARRAGCDPRWALMHDAAESYLADITRPVKSQLVGFEAMELRLLRAVAEWLGLPDPDPLPVFVTAIDDQMIAAEWKVLMPETVTKSFADVPASSPVNDIVIVPWTLEESKAKFVSMFNQIF